MILVLKRIRNYWHGYANPQNVYESLRPMLHICILVGILPVRMVAAKSATDRRSQYHYKVSRLGYFITIVHLVWFGTCFTKTFQSGCIFRAFFENTDGLASASETFQLIFSLVAMTIVYFFTFRKRYAFIAAIDVLARVDERFWHSFGRCQSHSQLMKRVFATYAAITIVLAVYMCGCAFMMWYADRNMNVFAWFSYFLPHIILLQLVFKFMTVLSQISRRFHCLNKVWLRG